MANNSRRFIGKKPDRVSEEVPPEVLEELPEEAHGTYAVTADGDNAPSMMPVTEEAPASTPVVDERPVTKRPDPKVEGAMSYLGTLYPAGMSNVRCALPIVIKDRKGILGVAVVSDPGFLGTALEKALEKAGYEGPFEQFHPTQLDRSGREAAARAIAAQKEQQLDKVGALASFGLSLAALGM